MQVKDLFKAQRDEPSRVMLTPDDTDNNVDGDGGLDTDDTNNANSTDASTDANAAAAESAGDDARSLAVAGTLKSALRMACTVTAKI